MSRRISRRPTRVPSGPGFTPRSLSGLVAWYRSDLGITIATGVSAWADQSGSGDANRNAAQGTGANQPTYTAADAAFGNQPSLTSTAASNQCLFTGVWSVALPAVATIVLVGKAPNTRYACDALTLAPQYACYSQGSNWALLQTLIDSSGISSTSASVLVSRFNGAASKANVSSNTAVTGLNVGTGTATGVTLLNSAVGGGFADGGATLAEIAYYNRLLTDAEVAAWNAYAGARYGLAIS